MQLQIAVPGFTKFVTSAAHRLHNCHLATIDNVKHHRYLYTQVDQCYKHLNAASIRPFIFSSVTFQSFGGKQFMTFLENAAVDISCSNKTTCVSVSLYQFHQLFLNNGYWIHTINTPSI